MDSSSGYQVLTMICTACVFTLHGPALLHAQMLVLSTGESAPKLANCHTYVEQKWCFLQGSLPL
jgi:hypothetical protein